jgi:HEAT repeat protein
MIVVSVATAVLQVLITAAAILGLVIVFGRMVRRARSARRTRLAGPARRTLLALAAGDNDPAVVDALVQLSSATWWAIEPTAIALLGKVRGDAHSALVSVLERRGLARRALRDVHRHGAVRRARAAEVLGSLGHRNGVGSLHRLLADPDPDVRVVAARSLGSIGDPASATALLNSLVGPRPVPPQLVAHALMRLGPDAQSYVQAGLDHPEELVRATAVEVLGLVGAIASAGRIEQALRDDRSLEVQVRAARSLGKLGTRTGLGPLLEAVAPGRAPTLRAIATRALGNLGSGAAVPILVELLADPQYAVAHRAAYALLRLGREGHAALRAAAETGTPAAGHAQEALAILELEERRRDTTAPAGYSSASSVPQRVAGG